MCRSSVYLCRYVSSPYSKKNGIFQFQFHFNFGLKTNLTDASNPKTRMTRDSATIWLNFSICCIPHTRSRTEKTSQELEFISYRKVHQARNYYPRFIEVPFESSLGRFTMCWSLFFLELADKHFTFAFHTKNILPQRRRKYCERYLRQNIRRTLFFYDDGK